MMRTSQDKYAIGKAAKCKVVVFLTVCVAMIYMSGVAMAQAPARQVIRGTVTAVSNDVLTVKSDAGEVEQVRPEPSAQIQKLAVGSTDFKSGVAATIADIWIGDRVLISANMPDSGPAVARIAFVMKAGDIGQKQAAEQADWQERGIGGLVRSIDPTANTVTISVVGAGGTKTITIRATDKTQLMRYASDSVKFADASPGSLTSIQAGDQLTARGDKSPDGLAITADEIVTGSFRNISGQIVKIDLPGNALTVKDLATKDTVTVALTSNTDMHMLPQAVATRFAARLKSGAGSGPAAGQARGQSDGGRSASSDLAQMISSMPPVTLAQLKPGDAIMTAATASTQPNSVTAITLLSGVEPILTAAPAASSMTLAPWSLSSGPNSQ